MAQKNFGGLIRIRRTNQNLIGLEVDELRSSSPLACRASEGSEGEDEDGVLIARSGT